MPWLQGFRDQLVAPATCAFVDWAAGTAGVLDRSRFEPPDLKPWLGDLSILQWEADTLLAATGRHGLWFSRDDQPLTPSPVAAETAGPHD